MAKLSDLVPALANVLGMPATTVNVVARHLREKRLLSTGGRGPGGADMTVRDCSNLLIGILGSEHAKDAPRVVRTFRRLCPLYRKFKEAYKPEEYDATNPVWNFKVFPMDLLIKLPQDHTFGAFLDALIEGSAEKNLAEVLEMTRPADFVAQFVFQPRIKIGIQLGIPSSEVTITTNVYRQTMVYGYPSPWSYFEVPPTRDVAEWRARTGIKEGPGDMDVIQQAKTHTIERLGQLLRDEPWEDENA